MRQLDPLMVMTSQWCRNRSRMAVARTSSVKTAVAGQRVDRDLPGGRPDLHRLERPDLAGGHRVQAGLEPDQAVLADPPQMLLGDQVRHRGQRPQRRVIGRGAHPDHLAVGAVHLGAADHRPVQERRVHLGQRAERPPGQHVGADDVHLALDPALIPHRQLHRIRTTGTGASG